MPALVNISVGSLRGTSGDDGTISWPLSAKNFRNVDLISLTPLILVPSRPKNVHDNAADGLSRAPLLNGGASTVQKVCRRSGACRIRVRSVDSRDGCVDSLGAAVI